jgi:hypothetical protein
LAEIHVKFLGNAVSQRTEKLLVVSEKGKQGYIGVYMKLNPVTNWNYLGLNVGFKTFTLLLRHHLLFGSHIFFFHKIKGM